MSNIEDLMFFVLLTLSIGLSYVFLPSKLCSRILYNFYLYELKQPMFSDYRYTRSYIFQYILCCILFICNWDP
jgi:hypothetical protein